MYQHVTLDGRTVRYLDAGSGRAVVLVHAFPLSSAMWLPQAAALPPGWRLIAPDLRGFGGSSRTVDDGEHLVALPAQAMDDYARDVLALLDALGLPRVVLGGLSMGGYVTFACWRLAPERVSALVLADTRSQADSDEAKGNRLRMLETLADGGVRAVADAMVPRLLGSTTRAAQPGLEAEVRALIESNGADGVGDAIRCLMTRPESTPLLSTIDCPVQLIVGREDELTPVALHDEMHVQLPTAALTVIESAGHLPNLERPEVFNRTLSRFLSSLPS